ncbi:MAG: DUF58 domain-containing protein [Pseudomonadota bacterium]
MPTSRSNANIPALLTDPLRLRRQGRKAAGVLQSLTPHGPLYSAHLRGHHGRKRAGSGDNFWQFRSYMPGDSASMIDWRRSARSDGHFVRQYEWEAARDVWLICDLGPHMMFSGDDASMTKAEHAAILTVALAHLLARGGERVGLMGQSQRPIAGKYGTDLIAEKLVQAVRAEPLDILTAAPPARGTHTIWISDFLTPVQRLRARLKALVRSGTQLHLVQLIDPYERDFPFSGRISFEGPSRTNGHLIESAQDIRSRYLGRLAKHQDHVETLAREAGATLLRHTTDASLSPCLVALNARLENPMVAL